MLILTHCGKGFKWVFSDKKTYSQVNTRDWRVVILRKFIYAGRLSKGVWNFTSVIYMTKIPHLKLLYC